MVKRGVFLFLFLLLLSSLAFAQEDGLKNSLNLTLFQENYGPQQKLEGFILLNVTKPLPKDEPLSFFINDEEIFSIALSNLTQGVKITSYPTHIEANGASSSTQDFTFTQPGSSVTAGLDLTQTGITKASDILDVLDFSVSIQGSQGVTSPSLNIGNDKEQEWSYVGPEKVGTFIPLDATYLGDKTVESEVTLTANTDDLFCENITLEPAQTFKISTLARAINTRTTLNATLTKIKPSGTIGLCGDDAPCCSFPTKPTSLQEMNCNIKFAVNDRTNYYACVFVDPKDQPVENEAFSLAMKNSQPSLGFRAGRKTPVNYFIWAAYQDYERQLATTISPDISEGAINAIKTYLKKPGCGDKCLIIPLNITSKSAGILTLKNLQLKLDTKLGRLTLSSFLPITLSPESLSYNLSYIKKDLHNYTLLRTPSVEGEDFIFKAMLGETTSNEVSLNVIPAPNAHIFYDKNTVSVGQTISFTGFATSPDDKKIIRYEWDFGDGTNALTLNPTHKYSKPGTYTVSFSAVDEEKIAGSTFETIVVTGVDFSQQLTQALNDLTAFKQKLQTDQTLQTLATALNLTSDLDKDTQELTDLQTQQTLAGDNQTKQQALENQFSTLAAKLPKDLTIESPITFDPTLDSQNQIPLELLSGTDGTALFQAQSSISASGKVSLVHIAYEDGSLESFILVEKTVSGQGTIYELLPPTIVLKKPLTPLDKAVTENVLSFTGPSLSYLVEGTTLKDLTSASQIKTLVIPEKLPEVHETQTNTLNLGSCGNHRCEAGEDEVSCPQDCASERPILPLILLGIILLLGITWIFFYKGKYSFTYFNSKKSIKYNARAYFKTDKDYQAVRSYVSEALKKGFRDDQIRIALKKKGWTEQQINAALQEQH